MFLNPKPIPPERKGACCQCGKPAVQLLPSVLAGRLKWIARCEGCTHPSQTKKGKA